MPVCELLATMHTDAEAFLARIRAYPDDDTHRLIFADWLDEQGDPRGSFIRIQLARAHSPESAETDRHLENQERALLEAHRATWEAPLRACGASGCEFRRGFVDEIKIEAQQLLRNAHILFSVSPIRHIHLLDVGERLTDVFRCPYLSRLAALTIHAQHIGDSLARVAAASEYLAGLKRLTLTKNRLTHEAAEYLAVSPHLAQLEELILTDNDIGETGARALAASPYLGHLQRLEVGGNRFGPAGAEAIACSESLGSLETVGFSDNGLGTPRLQTLARVSALLRIPRLDLAGNGLNANGLQAILHRPGHTEDPPVRLRELDLSFNELGDAGARVLAACPHLSQLEVLRLGHCAIGDEGARALANSPHLNHVAVLDLENNPIGDSGFRAFLESPYWRSLRRLNLPRGGLSPGIRHALDRHFNRDTRRG